MFDKPINFELLEKEFLDLLAINPNAKLSLNQFLEKHNLFMTREDYKNLKQILKTKKYKMVKTEDYYLVRRGKKK